jgi:hypothetical protein
LAGFHECRSYQVEFLSRTGEFVIISRIARAAFSVQITGICPKVGMHGIGAGGNAKGATRQRR